MSRYRLGRWAAGLAVLTSTFAVSGIGVASALSVSSPSPDDYTWTGQGLQVDPSGGNWSNSLNWKGGTNPAPTTSESIDALIFPDLGTCDNTIDTCYTSYDDIAGLSVKGLQFGATSSSYYVGSDPSAITPNSLSVGAGGISVADQSTPSGPQLSLPLVLSADQNWTLGANASVGLNSGITGTANLNVGFNAGRASSAPGYLNLFGTNEVGNLTLSGPAVAAGSTDPSWVNAENNGYVNLMDDWGASPSQPADLNGTDGNQVNVDNVDLAGDGTLGALTTSGSVVQVGNDTNAPGVLSVGSAKFDGGSLVNFNIDGTGTTPGTDYTQLQATPNSANVADDGSVDLGGVGVGIGTNYADTTGGSGCVTPALGTTYTLVQAAAGKLSGTFSDAYGHALPDGGVVLTGGCVPSGSTAPPPVYGFQLHYDYAAGTVTATAVDPTFTTVTTDTNPSTPGQSVRYTATVEDMQQSASPSGTVTIKTGSAVLCAAAPLTAGQPDPNNNNDATATASCASSAAPLGTDPVVATYTPASGSNFGPSDNSADGYDQWVEAPTTTSLEASTTSAQTGSPVSFTATVQTAAGYTTPNPTDGTMAFYEAADPANPDPMNDTSIDCSNSTNGGTVDVGSNGQAACQYTYTTTAASPDHVYAYYYGDPANDYQSSASNVVDVTVTQGQGSPTAPAKPSGVTATQTGDGAVTVGWSTDSGATSYSVFEGTTPGGESATPACTAGQAATSCAVTGLTDGTTYYFTVQASNSVGSSPVSAEVSATPVTPPAQPTNVSAAAGDSKVTVSWSSVSGATSYKVFDATSPGAEGTTPVCTATATDTSCAVTGLTNGTKYYFTVVASNAGGDSQPSSEVSATPEPAPPAKPTGVTATQTADRTVTVSWSADSGATSYKVFDATTPGGEGATPACTGGSTATSCAISGLTDGTTYYFTVVASNPGGDSPASGEVSATPVAPPTQPTNVSATAGDSRTTVAWGLVSGATSYKVFDATSPGAEGTTPVCTATATDTSCDVTGLTDGTKYYFTVVASNPGGSSAPSAEVSATPEPQPPAAPSGVKASAGDRQVTVSWSADARAASYSVYSGTRAGGESYTTPACTAGAAATSCTVTGLTDGTTYYFTVKAANGGGVSPASAEVSATPLAPAPPPPGTSSSDTTPLASSQTSSSSPTSLSGSTGSGAGEQSATVTVPAGALPSGTTVTLDSVNPASFTPPSGQSFVLGFAVSWVTPGGTAPTATAPITMKVTNLTPGDVVYMVGPDGGLTKVGTVAPDGTATVTFTQDPAFLVAKALTSGYRLVASDGGVFSFGAPFYGSTGNVHLAAPIVGSASTPAGGYYMVARDGGVFAFGPGARFQGSMGGKHLNSPIVGMAVDPATGGYWLVAADGGIFAFNAPFYGSTGNVTLTSPIVGIAALPDGSGYYMVAKDGGVFAFGPGARFQGSMGGWKLTQPIVGMAIDSLTHGYWLVASDGGMFSFNAPFHGSTGGMHLDKPIVGMAVDQSTGGYWLVASDGGIFSFNAPFKGSTGNVALNQPIVTMSAAG